MKKPSDNIMAYLAWCGDLSFDVEPFNEVDGFILSQLCFINFNGFITTTKQNIQTVINHYFLVNKKNDIKLGLLLSKSLFDLAKLISTCKRYENIEVSDYVEKKDKEQFSATTFYLNDSEIVIAYRGTDDSIDGWLEDFEMITKYPINAQKSAYQYFKHILKLNKKSLFTLLGHSKGGNLSIYTGLVASALEKKHIARIWNYDGPGFEAHNVDYESYLQIQDKITNFIPVASVVGMLFTRLGNTCIIESNGKSILQHDGFLWHVKRNQFMYAKKLLPESENFAHGLNELIQSVSLSERNSFYESLQKYVKLTNSKTLLELSNSKFKLIRATIAFTKNDKIIFNKLIRLYMKNLPK